LFWTIFCDCACPVTAKLPLPSYLSPVMADDERRAKRSRFDQTEPEPRRGSRFDRRSRSPSSRQPESTRTRSPLSREPFSPGADDSRKSGSVDPAAAAGMTSKKAAKPFFFSFFFSYRRS
jgi:hypothetical protein